MRRAISRYTVLYPEWAEVMSRDAVGWWSRIVRYGADPAAWAAPMVVDARSDGAPARLERALLDEMEKRHGHRVCFNPLCHVEPADVQRAASRAGCWVTS